MLLNYEGENIFRHIIYLEDEVLISTMQSDYVF